MTEEKFKAQREDEWWDAWQQEDFSREGLAKKLVGQTRDMMIQRQEPGPVGLHGESNRRAGKTLSPARERRRQSVPAASCPGGHGARPRRQPQGFEQAPLPALPIPREWNML
jgi:hypothetical protein